MTSVRQEADGYLLSTRCTFWRWSSDGSAVTWPSGDTIAFREELQAVLEHLAPVGLPPLGSIVLLLSATRDSWSQVPDKAGLFSGILKELPATAFWKDLLYDVLEGLTRIHLLDDELRKPIDAKRLLAEVVFEGQTDLTSPAVASEVLDLFESGPTELDTETLAGPWDWTNVIPHEFFRELRALRPGLLNVNADSLRMRARTGLEEPVKAAEVELPTHLRVRGLFAELQEDEELRGLCGLARRLMAAVTLPRQLSQPSGFEDGGVSDVANRGNLDRLLLSELAHDDLTLAVRIAVNEALYLRRESPPRPPSRTRSLLLEAGLRTWGTPRVFATAVALAIAANGDEKVATHAFRATGAGIEPINMTTREGLLAQLEALEPYLHCGSVLADFFNRLHEDQTAEPILILAEETFIDASFRQQLDSQKAYPVTVATVNRDGDFRLVTVTAAGVRPVTQAKLNLEQLISKPTTPPLVDQSARQDLPAIFSVHPFPLLLPTNVQPNRCCIIDNQGVLHVANDRRLLWWSSHAHGPKQLAESLPQRDVQSFLVSPDHLTAYILFNRNAKGQAHLLRVDLQEQTCTSCVLQLAEPVQSFALWDERILAVLKSRVLVVEPRTGHVLGEETLPNATRVTGRFLKSGENCYAMGLVNSRPYFEEVRSLRDVPFDVVFDCPGAEGPVAVTSNGRFFFYTSTGEYKEIPHRLEGAVRVDSVSPDGGKVLLKTLPPQNPRYVEADPVENTVSILFPRLDQVFWSRAWKYVNSVTLRNRFRSISVLPNGRIALKGRGNRSFAVTMQSSRGPLYLDPLADWVPLREKQFHPHSTSHPFGFKLQRAIWEDGSKAVLDSRGLLHLRSSNKQVPEVTLVLDEKVISGWCSDGNLWGTPFLIGNQPNTEPWYIFERVLVPFCERAR